MLSLAEAPPELGGLVAHKQDTFLNTAGKPSAAVPLDTIYESASFSRNPQGPKTKPWNDCFQPEYF